jgi:hypothetical protein
MEVKLVLRADLTPPECMALAAGLDSYLDLDPRSREFFRETASLDRLRAGRSPSPLALREITHLQRRLPSSWWPPEANASIPLDDQVGVCRDVFGAQSNSRDLFFDCHPSETPEQAIALLRSHLPADLVIDIVPDPPDFISGTRT